MIAVEFRQSLGEIRDVSVPALIATDFPAAYENAIAIDQRDRFQLPGHPPHPPQLFACIERVRSDFERTGNDQLGRSRLWTVHPRRRLAARVFGTYGFPQLAAIGRIDGEKEGDRCL